MEMTQPIEKNPTWQAGFAAGWAAYGDLMIEQLGPDGMVWRPIETAPKDGRGILVIDKSAPAPEAGPAWFKYGVWTAVPPGGEITIAPETYRAITWPAPTHWMPIPKPPMASARKEAA